MREAMGNQVVACLSGTLPQQAADAAAERMDKIMLEGTK
jgi:hypothetical protein